MKRILYLILFCLIGLLIGFVIGNKDKIFSPRAKEVKVVYDTSKKVEVDKSKDVVVNTSFKNDKNLSINISNIKKETVKITVPIKNNSKKDDALITFKTKYNKEVMDINIKPNKLELKKNSSNTIEYEIVIKDLSKLKEEKLELDITLVASPL